MAANNLQTLYHLSRMPFELGRYDSRRVGREDEWQRIHEIVDSGRSSRGPLIAVLLGTYGSGKSFLLWKTAESYNPPIKTKVLASRPIRLIDPEQRRDFIKNLVIRLFRRGFDYEALVAVIRAAARNRKELPTRLKRFGDLLLALGDDKAAPVARRVLHGGRAQRSEAISGGFPDAVQVKSNDDAIELLEALQTVVMWAGVEVVALMIDETEFIDGLPRVQQTAVFDSIKHLWDQEVAFFSKEAKAAQLIMLLSATPSFWQLRTQQLRAEEQKAKPVVGLTPFFARVSQENVIEMPTELARNEARDLIVSRMSEAREGKEELIPFTDDYVDYVYEITQGLPRTIIEICATVVSEAARRKVKKIDREAARQILKDLLISYEPVTSGQ